MDSASGLIWRRGRAEFRPVWGWSSVDPGSSLRVDASWRNALPPANSPHRQAAAATVVLPPNMVGSMAATAPAAVEPGTPTAAGAVNDAGAADGAASPPAGGEVSGEAAANGASPTAGVKVEEDEAMPEAAAARASRIDANLAATCPPKLGATLANIGQVWPEVGQKLVRSCSRSAKIGQHLDQVGHNRPKWGANLGQLLNIFW